jgi:hypothetical protein
MIQKQRKRNRTRGDYNRDEREIKKTETLARGLFGEAPIDKTGAVLTFC